LKTALIVTISVILAVVLLGLWLLFGIPMHVNTSFASQVLLKNHYSENIDVVVTDVNDIKTLKDLLNGWAIATDSNSYYNEDTVSITLTNGRQDIVFRPCFGDDPCIEIDHTYKFRILSDKQKATLDKVLKKYGMVIP
jgi:hypothetical protein